MNKEGRKVGIFLNSPFIGSFPAFLLSSFLPLLFLAEAKADLTIGAAISMGNALEEIVEAYPGEKPRLTFSGTNVIARQIEAGAPIDVFISADTATLTALAKKKLISSSSIRTIASNELVVVVPAASKTSLKSAHDLLSLKRIAIADPTSVPAGIYAKKWLTAENIWPKLQRKTIPLQNVRAALIAAETSNADAAIVYRSDAASSDKVKIAFTAPAEKTGSIEYPAAIVSASKNHKEAALFIEFLTSETATAILLKHGFAAP
ncbi:MAG: molybdate ABC transporter substrate-binding protein [Akkermansiaceae bacterium]|jgi:molybdate transport system substrate-binding protein|nr:molybdate ABC transporter substrate-binding protein [Akkermansiaceae bacterium]